MASRLGVCLAIAIAALRCSSAYDTDDGTPKPVEAGGADAATLPDGSNGGSIEDAGDAGPPVEDGGWRTVFEDTFDEPDRPTLTNLKWTARPGTFSVMELADGGAPGSDLRVVTARKITPADGGGGARVLGDMYTTIAPALSPVTETELSFALRPESDIQNLSSIQVVTLALRPAEAVAVSPLSVSIVVNRTNVGEVGLSLFGNTPCDAGCAVGTTPRSAFVGIWVQVVLRITQTETGLAKLEASFDGIPVSTSIELPAFEVDKLILYAGMVFTPRPLFCPIASSRSTTFACAFGSGASSCTRTSLAAT